MAPQSPPHIQKATHQPQHTRVQRLAVLLLALLALLFLDGFGFGTEEAPAEPIAVEAAVEDAPRPDTERLATLLGSVNVNLDEAERTRIAAAILRYSEKYELDPELVTAVMLVESSARPWAHSPKGAVGLMQVMPHMMQPMGLAGNAATIEANVEAGCFILAHNIRRLGEDEGISTYFWGSNIRGVAYLEKVRAARAEVHRFLAS